MYIYDKQFKVFNVVPQAYKNRINDRKFSCKNETNNKVCSHVQYFQLLQKHGNSNIEVCKIMCARIYSLSIYHEKRFHVQRWP